MAVDSRDKRSSAINVSSPWRGMLPLPDGTVDQADRQHAPFVYAGISASSAAPAAARGINAVLFIVNISTLMNR